MYLTYLWEGLGIPLWRSLQSVGLSTRCLRRAGRRERESLCCCTAAVDKRLQNERDESQGKKHRGGCVEEELRKILPEFHNDGAIAPLLPNIQWMSVKSIISSLMMQSGPKGVHRKINIIECKVWGKGKTKSGNV